MIRRLLRALLRLDRYERVGIACGVVVLAAVTGVLGPTVDSKSPPSPPAKAAARP